MTAHGEALALAFQRWSDGDVERVSTEEWNARREALASAVSNACAALLVAEQAEASLAASEQAREEAERMTDLYVEQVESLRTVVPFGAGTGMAWHEGVRAALAAERGRSRALRAALSRASNSLRTVGDDYPGSSCHDYCHRAADDADTVLLAAEPAPAAALSPAQAGEGNR